MKKILFSFLFCAIVVALTACGNKTTTTNAPQTTASTPAAASAASAATTASSASAILEDPAKISYTPEEAALMQRLNEILAESSKVEYVFYLPGYAMTTEMDDPNQLRSFVYYVAPKTAPRYNCELEIGMAIRNKNTDEIHLTIDAVVTKPECAYANVTFDGKTHKMSMTKPGVQHVMQFLNIKPGSGAPVAH